MCFVLYNWDSMFLCLRNCYRHGHNLVLLKFAISQLEMVKIIYSSCLASDRYPYKIEAKCISRSKMTTKSRKWVGIRHQYPRDILKPSGLKNDLKSMRSIERNMLCFYPSVRCFLSKEAEVVFQKASGTDCLQFKSVIALQKIDILEQRSWTTEVLGATQYLEW